MTQGTPFITSARIVAMCLDYQERHNAAKPADISAVVHVSTTTKDDNDKESISSDKTS